jgi:signal transduction histidine kinase
MKPPACHLVSEHRWIRNALGSGGLLLSLLLRAADPAFPKQTLQTVTNIAQLRQRADDGPRALYSVHLEGVVCAANPEKGVIFLQDETGVVQIRLNLQGQSVQPGAKVRVEGNGIMEGTYLGLEAVPLVDNDGAHTMRERSGAIYLTAGWHPIRVVWFNISAGFGLEIYYRGPDLPRQTIPGAALFREQVDPQSGNTNWISGLYYRYYEGTNWSRLPDFNQLTNVKAGTVTNFDVSVINRTNNVGLEFNGYVELARDGLYTFTTSSDDGSRLFVGEAQGRLEVIGSGPPPIPRPVAISRALSGEEDRQWSEVEGIVTFVSEQLDGYELELSSEAGRMRVKVAGNSSEVPAFLLNSQVRAIGVCWSTYTSGEQKVAGALVVADWKQIELTQVAAEYWNVSPLVPIGSLLATNNPARTNEAIVRVQGRFRGAASDARWVLEDDTGQIPVEGTQAPPKAVGTRVELLGKLKREGSNSVLQNGFYREMIESTNGTAAALPVLTSAKQIQYLSREEARRGYPVRIRGVVIATYTWQNSFVLQDATHGIFVRGLPDGNPPKLGDFYEVDGLTDPGDFAPTALAERVKCLGAGRMPEPLHPNRDQLINGSLDAQYVELQGIVTAVEPSGVTLLMLAGKYKVELVGMLSRDLNRFENALVRIKGCFITSWDAQTKQIRIGQIRIFNASINVDEPAPADLFDAPVKTATELLLFDAKASALKRIKVSGQIVHERAGEYYLMNETNGLRFFLKAAIPLELGDRVEVVGFPELGGTSPVFREAVARKTGTPPMPKAETLPADMLLSADRDATLVSLESHLVSFRSNRTEQVLELQAGPRTYLARLDARNGSVQPMPMGSRLQLTGVYAGQGGNRTEGRDIDSFELLLNSPADVKVLQRPAWWTIRHTLLVVGALAAVLLFAIVWITALRRQVNQRTRQLKDEIEEHKRTEAKLAEEIEERKRMELVIERTHQELMIVSRQAGQAEVASSVLHNVGNVLNSVNVSAGVISDRLRRPHVANLAKAVGLIREHQADLTGFLNEDPRGRQLLPYLEQMASRLNHEQNELLSEVKRLAENVDHIKEIVATQQDYAKVSGVTEKIAVAEVIESALKMHFGAFARHSIAVEREYEEVPPVVVDKHKLLQILVNLLHNAKYACDEAGRSDKKVVIRIKRLNDERVVVEIADNGIGIPPDNLTRIFAHGFTTRKNSHGFGLHSAALAAKEMSGSLVAHSEGLGKGATFTLELPVQPESATQVLEK